MPSGFWPFTLAAVIEVNWLFRTPLKKGTGTAGIVARDGKNWVWCGASPLFRFGPRVIWSREVFEQKRARSASLSRHRPRELKSAARKSAAWRGGRRLGRPDRGYAGTQAVMRCGSCRTQNGRGITA